MLFTSCQQIKKKDTLYGLNICSNSYILAIPSQICSQTFKPFQWQICFDFNILLINSIRTLREPFMPTQETRTQNTKMRISIISFGFKHGLPPESKLLIDVRFVPNPYYVPELKDLDGTDARVRQYVKHWTGAEEIFAHLKHFGRDVSMTHRDIGLG